jgi:hypothetical protein
LLFSAGVWASGAFTLGCNSSAAAPAPVLYGDASAGGPETPPATNGADVEAWLKTGAYLKWACEPAVHASRGPSPHGFDRVCSNDVVSPVAAQGDAGAWPQGAAEVKELYTSLTATVPGGYAVSVKTQAESAGGAGWYWYERLTEGSIEADGPGSSGPSQSICVACHTAAGSSAANTTSPGSRDFIYTPVPTNDVTPDASATDAPDAPITDANAND